VVAGPRLSGSALDPPYAGAPPVLKRKAAMRSSTYGSRAGVDVSLIKVNAASQQTREH